jgi:ribosomal protein L11 methyltransferase
MQSIEIKAGASSFGDGQHPTTRGMLEAIAAMDGEVFAPRIACDMGAGSGILSLIVAQKFHCPVVAVDIEAASVDTIRENATHNHVPLGVVYGQGCILPILADGFSHPDITAHAPYDFILANILAGSLVSLARTMEANLSPGGVLLISGLLQWQEAVIREAYQSLGLELASRVLVGDWVTLGWAKP